MTPSGIATAFEAPFGRPIETSGARLQFQPTVRTKPLAVATQVECRLPEEMDLWDSRRTVSMFKRGFAIWLAETDRSFPKIYKHSNEFFAVHPSLPTSRMWFMRDHKIHFTGTVHPNAN